MSAQTTDTERDFADGEPAVEREIDHDEFDPIGTAVLIGLYFLVLVVMWFFMYFVEFLGNGPTVVGLLPTVVGI